MKRAILLCLSLLCLSYLSAGQTMLIVNGNSSSGLVPIALGVHCSQNNGSTASTTVACGSITPSAGSTISCWVKVSTSTTGMGRLSDGGGAYEYDAGPLRDPEHNFILFGFYRENVAASAINPTYTAGASVANLQIECHEFKGVRATYAFDSNFVASQATTGANANSGTSLTPTNNNSVVDAGLFLTSPTTATAGTSFTLVDGAVALWPEYRIQTTKTATTGAFTNSSNAYAASQVAFAQKNNLYCDSTMVYDWSGGIDGGTPTTTTLGNSVHGNASQANVDWIYGSLRPGSWVVSNNGTGLTYAAGAAQALATTLNCPVYSGTANSGLGLKRASANPTTNVKNRFITSSTNASFGQCMWTDTPTTRAGTADIINISGGDAEGTGDYVNLQWNSNGITPTFALESPTRATQTSATHWDANHKYWILITFKRAGQHTIAIYDGCGTNPTLLETLTSPGVLAGGGPADQISFFGGNSDSYAAGTNWYIGSVKADILYGATLLP